MKLIGARCWSVTARSQSRPWVTRASENGASRRTSFVSKREANPVEAATRSGSPDETWNRQMASRAEPALHRVRKRADTKMLRRLALRKTGRAAARRPVALARHPRAVQRPQLNRTERRSVCRVSMEKRSSLVDRQPDEIGQINFHREESG